MSSGFKMNLILFGFLGAIIAGVFLGDATMKAYDDGHPSYRDASLCERIEGSERDVVWASFEIRGDAKHHRALDMCMATKASLLYAELPQAQYSGQLYCVERPTCPIK